MQRQSARLIAACARARARKETTARNSQRNCAPLCRTFEIVGACCQPSLPYYIAGSAHAHRAGGMAEWLKAHAWKACIRETVSWVRIPLPPLIGDLLFPICYSNIHTQSPRRTDDLQPLRSYSGLLSEHCRRPMAPYILRPESQLTDAVEKRVVNIDES